MNDAAELVLVAMAPKSAAVPGDASVNEPKGSGVVPVRPSKIIDSCGPANIEGDNGPLRSDCKLQPYCSSLALIPADGLSSCATGGKLGFGLLVPLSERGLAPEKLCSNGFGSKSCFEQAAKNLVGVCSTTGGGSSLPGSLEAFLIGEDVLESDVDVSGDLPAERIISEDK
jgi:hypothetical protein